MGRSKRVSRWLIRPQLLISLLAGLLVCGGYAVPRAAPTKHSTHAKPQVAGVRYRAPDCSVEPCVALTFDDGPSARLTPKILDILDRQRVHATFFVLGNRVADNQGLLRRMHREGHEIGNHTWSHRFLTTLSPEQIKTETNTTQAAVAQAGVPVPRLFRPPYNDITPAIAAQIPLTIVRWNIDPEDWRPKKQTQLVEQVMAHLRPGGIVILHDTEETTVAQLDALITQLKSQNYNLVTASEILDLPTGQPGTFFGRYKP